MNDFILTPDYKLFLTCIYVAGVLTGGVISAIVISVQESQKRKRRNNVKY